MSFLEILRSILKKSKYTPCMCGHMLWWGKRYGETKNSLLRKRSNMKRVERWSLHEEFTTRINDNYLGNTQERMGVYIRGESTGVGHEQSGRESRWRQWAINRHWGDTELTGCYTYADYKHKCINVSGSFFKNVKKKKYFRRYQLPVASGVLLPAPPPTGVERETPLQKSRPLALQ